VFMIQSCDHRDREGIIFRHPIEGMDSLSI